MTNHRLRRISALGSLLCVALFWFAPTAHAEVGWEDNYLVKRWPTSYSACLDGEILPRISAFKRANPGLQYRYRSINVSEYLPDEESQCQFVIERSLGSRWITAHQGQYVNFAYGSYDPCPQGATDASGYCMPKSAGPPCPPCNGSNPINSGTGNKYQEETDYEGAAQFPLALRRYYNSLSRENGPLGLNWRHHYQRRIVTLAVTSDLPSRVRLDREDGRRYEFSRVSGGAWTPDGDVSYRLANIATTPVGWMVTTDRDEVEVYDAEGLLQSITRRNGQRQTLSYEVPSEAIGARLLRVTDQDGRTLQFSYDSSNRIASIALPATGSSVTYSYDTVGRLATVTYADASTRSYQYNESAYVGANQPTALTGITDESGARFAYFYYDAQGRATRSEHAGGADRVVITYGSGSTRTITDALGAARAFGYATFATTRSVPTGISAFCDHCGGQAASLLNYDANANVVLSRDFKNVDTVFTYDTARNLEISRTQANGTPLQRTLRTTWHSTYRLPARIEEPNRLTTFTFDAAGNSLTKTVTDLTTSPNVSRVWTYTYDATGKVLTQDGPRTDVSDITTNTYYNCTTAFECGKLQSVTNALGQTTTYNTYNAHGQPLTITDSNGVVTTLTYDARQRLRSHTTAGETTTFEYWPTGLLRKVTQPDSSYVLYTYDAAHRLINVEDGLGNRIQYTLDALGNHTAENVYDPSGVLARTRSQVFNSLNQLWKRVGAAGTAAVTTTFGYDENGNRTTVSAPLGRNTTHAYDELNRLKQITDPANGVTQLSYDVDDNLTALTDPRNLVTSSGYNGFWDQQTQTSPDTGLTSNSYDTAGNLTTSTDARGVLATYTYDELNRVTSRAFSLGAVTDQTINFSYDAGTFGRGHLTGASDADHALAWTYDALGRVVGKGQTVGGVTLSVGYGYSNGQLSTITLPSGQLVTYGYNANNQITSVRVGPTTVLSNALYDPFGPVSGWMWGNGTVMSRTYDKDGKLEQFDSSGLKTYGYDDAFRITGITDADEGANSWTYGYDLLDRMTSAGKAGTSLGWSYDPNGNRLTQSGSSPSTYTLSSTSNKISSISGGLTRTYGYDSAGNTIAYSEATVAYNNRGRMKMLTKASVTANYVYNALGQLVKQSGGPSGTVLYVYDEAGHLIGEYSSTGTLIQETLWLNDIPVATIRPDGASVSIYYVHADHLSTPIRVTRPSDNKLMWTGYSSPFGTDLANENPAGEGTFRYNLRFAGQIYDSFSGLHYNYFRDYDPATGRYLESDPIGLAGGVNTYAYVKNNPLGASDPFGLLVRGDGWSNGQWSDIERAEKRIRNELRKSCSCRAQSSSEGCIPCDLLEPLLSRLDAAIVSYAPLGGDCGWTPPGQTRGLFMSEVAWNKKKCPGCLATTLYHELLHTVGLEHDPTAGKPGVNELEQRCMGNLCKGSPQ